VKEPCESDVVSMQSAGSACISAWRTLSGVYAWGSAKLICSSHEQWQDAGGVAADSPAGDGAAPPVSRWRLNGKAAQGGQDGLAANFPAGGGHEQHPATDHGARRAFESEHDGVGARRDNRRVF